MAVQCNGNIRVVGGQAQISLSLERGTKRPAADQGVHLRPPTMKDRSHVYL